MAQRTDRRVANSVANRVANWVANGVANRVTRTIAHDVVSSVVCRVVSSVVCRVVCSGQPTGIRVRAGSAATAGWRRPAVRASTRAARATSASSIQPPPTTNG